MSISNIHKYIYANQPNLGTEALHLQIKGKGPMRTFFVNGVQKDESKQQVETNQHQECITVENPSCNHTTPTGSVLISRINNSFMMKSRPPA